LCLLSPKEAVANIRAMLGELLALAVLAASGSVATAAFEEHAAWARRLTRRLSARVVPIYLATARGTSSTH
jgi:hypothetical protein